MINLLSSETRRQLKAAHTNSTLANYLLISGLGLAFLTILCVASYLFLVNNKSETDKSANDNQSESSTYTLAQKQLETIQGNISSAKTILDQQISYSKLITNLAAILPSGVILEKLDINNNTIDSPISIQAWAKSEDSVNTIKSNLQKSLNFTSTNVVSNTDSQSNIPGYTISISIDLTVNRSSIQ